MSSFFTTALLGLALVAASVSSVASAQDTTTKLEPCLGELCPPKSPREDMPRQVDGVDQVKPMQGQDQSSGQVKPRKKKQASIHRNQLEQPSSQVKPRKKKQASVNRKRHQQKLTKKAASRSNFWDWLF